MKDSLVKFGRINAVVATVDKLWCSFSVPCSVIQVIELFGKVISCAKTGS